MDPEIIMDQVRDIMVVFADRTGLSSDDMPARRYLWTDAFAVCNFLTLYRRTGDEKYLRLALDLVAQVHSVLGRYRDDDPESGWISGLDERAGAEHPTMGGLRIGKPLKERKPDELYDERLEWDRDGQYFHYLTKWMHALERVGVVTGDAIYIRWAIELAKAAQAAFLNVPVPGGAKSLYWKMSIDLSRPLVPSMGLHDPLDGFITYSELRTCAQMHPDGTAGLDLASEISDTAEMCEAKSFATDDSLGVGGLLFDACRVAQMVAGNHFEPHALAEELLRSSKFGLDAFLRRGTLNAHPESRLAFRELGLSIGLRAVEKMRGVVWNCRSLFDASLAHQIDVLSEYSPLGGEIENFWCDTDHQQGTGWQAHRDINMVMLATSLAPDEFLSI